jgi:hypothetical protein
VNDPDGDDVALVVLSLPSAGGSLTNFDRSSADVLTDPPVAPTLNSPLSNYLAHLSFRNHPATFGRAADSFAVAFTDGKDQGASATVTVDVVKVNRPPVAPSTVVQVVEDTPRSFTLNVTDPDVDDVRLGNVFAAIRTLPTRGTLLRSNGQPITHASLGAPSNIIEQWADKMVACSSMVRSLFAQRGVLGGDT